MVIQCTEHPKVKNGFGKMRANKLNIMLREMNVIVLSTSEEEHFRFRSECGFTMSFLKTKFKFIITPENGNKKKVVLL